ncbi:AcrR family transcriptional regulator [Rhodococcus sp. 27YEA15]|uniref:TetR/AcrR family transcriptional regulator n=1 Tax=Rhodococcus sp. 27YEA15 TaxID=3156259 RepID=UPI003C7A248A
MVKRISADERREQVAEAVWRVIRRDGIASASVRTVADEAGMSTGSLRHLFASQSELMLFAMELVTVRVEMRIAALVFDADSRRALRQFADQFVPLDADRREEMIVWRSFATAAVTDSALTAVRDRTNRTLFEKFRELIQWSKDDGHLLPDAPVHLEAMRLHALVDGLAAQAVDDPDRITTDAIAQVLDAHCRELFDSEREPSPATAPDAAR